MSDDAHRMPEGAEGGLPAKLAPKQQPKKLPKSASPEESFEIQQLVNTLSQALKQSMAVSTETASKGMYEHRVSIRPVKISKHDCPSFFSMGIWYISNRHIVERIC